MNLLITGGAGFIGSNFIREALGELREVSFDFEPQGSKIIFVG